jgi:hypothetical protein
VDGEERRLAQQAFLISRQVMSASPRQVMSQPYSRVIKPMFVIFCYQNRMVMDDGKQRQLAQQAFLVSRQVMSLSHRKCLQSRFADVSSRTNPSSYHS